MASKNISNSYRGMKPYKLQKNNFCFILSNTTFVKGIQHLPGYEADVDNIKKTFQGMNFVLHHKENKTAHEMQEILQNWSQMDFANADECLVLFILSHGNDHGLIYGTDGNTINITDVKSLFSNESCKALKGKPKLIFVQACRGDLTPPTVLETYSAAGPPPQRIFHDILVYYSTIEGYVSLVHKTKGTCFINSVCNVLKGSAGTLRLTKLLAQVNREVSSTAMRYKCKAVAQAPQATFHLRSDILFPSYSDNVDVERVDATIEPYTIKERNTCFLLMNNTCKSVNDPFSENTDEINQTLESLNFQVDVTENLDSDGIRKEYESWANYRAQDCFACIIRSCGGIMYDMEVIYGTDGKYIALENMVSAVTMNPTLRGKPKLFFIVLNKCQKNSHRSKKVDCEEYDAAVCDNKNIKSIFADTFVYYVMLESGEDSSMFFKIFFTTMLECARQKYHLVDMILQINESLAQHDITSEARSSLTYDVYFKHEVCVQSVQDTEEADISKYNTVIPGRSRDTPYLNVDDQDECDEEWDPTKEQRFCSSVITTSQSTKVQLEDCRGKMDDRDLKVGTTGSTNTVQPTVKSCQSSRGRGRGRGLGMGQVQGRGLGRGRGRGRGMTNAPSPVMKVVSDPTVEMLKFKHIDHLKSYLDPDTLGSNWLQLGHLIFQDDRDMKDKVTHLKRENSPGEALLDYLKIMGITVKRFVDVAKALERNDIVNLFENKHNASTLNDLHITLLNKIVLRLDVISPGIKSWRDFAHLLECTKEQIDLFPSKKANNEMSPTEGLLNLIKSSKVDYKLSELKIKLRELGRNDVAQYLENYVIIALSSGTS